MSPNTVHPKDSAIYWTGSGICTTRVLNITQKGTPGQEWVNYLFEKHRNTLKNQYKEKKLNKIEKKLPKNIKQMKRADLQTAIATIITNPNKTWKNSNKKNTWYQNHTSKTVDNKSKTIGPTGYK